MNREEAKAYLDSLSDVQLKRLDELLIELGLLADPNQEEPRDGDQ
jgi:hypothetical protein